MTQPISSPPARPATSQSVSPAPETGTLPPYREPAGNWRVTDDTAVHVLHRHGEDAEPCSRIQCHASYGGRCVYCGGGPCRVVRYSLIGVAWGEPLVVCGTCWAVVPGWAVERHDNFHRVWHRGALGLVSDGSRASDPRLPGQLLRPEAQQ